MLQKIEERWLPILGAGHQSVGLGIVVVGDFVQRDGGATDVVGMAGHWQRINKTYFISYG